jgi:DNA invertase Pin-like site-specific DNA recombinase
VQVISEDFQVKHYKEYILSHENWILAGIYEDGRTTGTKVKHREQFQKMIEACENGEIDFIITRSVNCFSENVKECLSTIRKLKELKKPVDIYFEVEQMYAMDENTERILERISSGSQEK